MTLSPASTLGTLTYASPDVHTSPPHTGLRMVAAAMLALFRALLACVKLCVVALGYTVLAAGIALRFVFALIAMILLFLGGLRWDVVKRRTLRTAEWVDVKVLATVGFFRRHLFPRSAGGDVAR